MRQLIHAIGIRAQTLKKNAQSSVTVVGLGWTSFLDNAFCFAEESLL
jgi:hypothetical protein